MAFSKIFLSNSTLGNRIPITGVGPSQGTSLHTAITGSADYDEIYIYAVNYATDSRDVTINFGATAAGVTTNISNHIRVTVTAASLPVLVVPGFILNGGLFVEGFATAAATATGGVSVYGYVHRVT